MRTYATNTDLAASPWLLTITPEAAARPLHYASLLVSRATKTAIYDTDSEGFPVLEAVRDAMRDAVCSQVSTWSILSINPAAGAADPGKTIVAKSLGSASLQYAAYASTVEAKARAATHLSSEALMILEEAGLIGWEPVILG